MQGVMHHCCRAQTRGCTPQLVAHRKAEGHLLLLLLLLAGQKVKDLRTWLTTYSYWNQGGLDNVVSMFLYLAKECFAVEGA